MSDKLQKLQTILELMQNDTVKPSDIEKFLQGVLQFIKQSKDNFDTLSKENIKELQKAIKDIENEYSNKLSFVKEETGALREETKKAVHDMNVLCETTLLQKPKDGKDADEEVIVDKVIQKIVIPEQVSPKLYTADEVRDLLETLVGDNRLDVSAIRNLPEPTSTGGRGSASTIKDAPKDGLTYGRRNRSWVVISTTGSGMQILTATGDIDDTNKDFTFTSEPLIIVVNGATYRKGNGWSWDTLTATLDNVVGTNGEIYGLV